MLRVVEAIVRPSTMATSCNGKWVKDWLIAISQSSSRAKGSKSERRRRLLLLWHHHHHHHHHQHLQQQQAMTLRQKAVNCDNWLDSSGAAPQIPTNARLPPQNRNACSGKVDTCLVLDREDAPAPSKHLERFRWHWPEAIHSRCRPVDTKYTIPHFHQTRWRIPIIIVSLLRQARALERPILRHGMKDNAYPPKPTKQTKQIFGLF